MGSLITLTTDFGQADGFPAVMKGVILAMCKDATIIDITHQLPAFDVQSAAWVLYNSCRYFPDGTVHVAVVDPGVGSKRRAIAAKVDGWYFVGPDNGLLSYFLGGEAQVAAYELTERSFFRPEVSSTFHGRDIFAPVAAHIANGVQLDKLGTAVPSEDLVRFRVPMAAKIGSRTAGTVVYIDHFGNLITNIPASQAPLGAVLMMDDEEIATVGLTYSSGAPGQAVAFVGSHGYLEIGICQGKADQMLGARIGQQVFVQD